MSVLFGRWNLSGEPAPQGYVEKVAAILAPYGPDGCALLSHAPFTLMYRPFTTTEESRRESQPHRTKSGSIVTWDGRLDNRKALRDQLDDVSADSTDIEVVAAAFDRWGTNCFAKLIGDWAVAIVNLRANAVTLAKDFVGTRHLYYAIEKDHITWSTILDPLVLFSDQTKSLNDEYLAGWFSSLPAAHLTPYQNVHSVPPSSIVRLRPVKHEVQQYWDFDPCHKIRYKTDGEYEEHFRLVFQDAVGRRLRCDTPILAELSGGMDSSSIVCVADNIASSADLIVPRIDTISYYDDSEPNWNERPYFSKVEEKRGRVGCHIDVGVHVPPSSAFPDGTFSVTPGSRNGGASEVTAKFAACLSSGGNRVVLSGVGGDEVTGGVPTPLPELQDLLFGLRFFRLANQLKEWALQKRQPWFYIFAEAVRSFLPLGLVGVAKQRRPPTWLTSQFVKRNQAALRGYARRVTLLGGLPSFQENIATLDVLRRQMACEGPMCEPLFETRYPFLDRDLLEFIYAIPREQLVRPGQRRSLLRRALKGTVPDEILGRRRKAFVSRGPITDLSERWPRSLGANEDMVSASLGIVDTSKFLEMLRRVKRDTEVPAIKLIRTFEMEHWLRDWKRWADGRVQNEENNSSFSAPALAHPKTDCLS